MKAGRGGGRRAPRLGRLDNLRGGAGERVPNTSMELNIASPPGELCNKCDLGVVTSPDSDSGGEERSAQADCKVRAWDNNPGGGK